MYDFLRYLEDLCWILNKRKIIIDKSFIKHVEKPFKLNSFTNQKNQVKFQNRKFLVKLHPLLSPKSQAKEWFKDECKEL